MKKIVLLAAVMLGLILSACGGEMLQNTAAETELPLIITENELGTIDGCDYELWKDNGTTEMSINGSGLFSCKWSGINNALFRIGKKFDCTQTWEEIGTINVDYGAEYAPVGNSYLCIYGWTREPLVEYYVVQSWGNWRPPGAEAIATVDIGEIIFSDNTEDTRED